MNFNHPNRNNSTIAIRAVCAIVFVLFTFVWLYFFQADILAVAQHVLSQGLTHYQRLVGATLITAVLFLLKVGVTTVTRLTRRWHALVYVPSFLALAFLSDVSEHIAEGYMFGKWIWLGPLVLVAWGVVAGLARSYQPYEANTGQTRLAWFNLLQLAVMMLAVSFIGNTNAVFHYRAHVETSLMQDQLDEALRTGEKSLETDASLTMLRMYGLAREGKLGERLFEYPIGGTSADILPLAGSASRCLLFPPDSIYVRLGALPRPYMGAMQYLDALIRHGQDTLRIRRDSLMVDTLLSPARDYQLCGLLIDRNLDGFARQLTQYYAVNDSLPKHYREALTLYSHLRSTPIVEYHNAVMDEDFSDYRALEKQYATPMERKGRVREKYEHTYWYYYDY